MTARDHTRITITDVAAKAEVSPAAVSQILNGKGNFPEKTIDRVRAVAEELGYRPSRVATSLRTGKTRTVGLFLTGSTDPVWSSQWVHVTARLLVDAAEQLNRRGYSLLVLPADRMNSVSRGDVDAVIISDSEDDDPTLEASLAANIPVLTNDRLTDDRVTVHVDSGYAEMAEFSFDLFRTRGRIRPGLLTEPSALHTDAVAERTWRALCEKNGVEPLIEQVDVDRGNLSTAVRSLLDQGADALFSFAGEGLAVADIIDASGKTLGSDVLLVTCEIGTPLPTVQRGISTLLYNAEKGALLSVPVLLQILDGALSAPQTVSLGWEFIEGASTGDPAT